LPRWSVAGSASSVAGDLPPIIAVVVAHPGRSAAVAFFQLGFIG